jgi:hypothetical protein
MIDDNIVRVKLRVENVTFLLFLVYLVIFLLRSYSTEHCAAFSNVSWYTMHVGACAILV